MRSSGHGAKVLGVFLGVILLFSSFQSGLDNFLHPIQPDKDLANKDNAVQNAYALSLPGTNLVTQIEMLDYYFPIISTSFINVPGTEFNLDPSLYDGQVTFFFEVVMQSTQQGGTVTAQLFDKAGNVVVPNSTVSTGSTSPTRVKSSALTLSSLAKEYVVQVSTSSSSNLGILLSARIIVQQNAATNTSIVVPIGNVALSLTGQPDTSNSMFTSSTSPTFVAQIAKIYHFNQTKFDGSLNIFFESVIKTNQLQRTAFASLFDLTTNSVVTGSEVSTSNLIQTRVRSGNLTLTNGHDYTFAVRSSATDAIATSFADRIIIAQKNFTSTEIPIRVANIFATTSSTFINVPTAISSINVSSFTSPRFSFETDLFTKNATLPASANLFNLTNNAPISGSTLSSSGTISTRVNAGIINLVGTSEYIAQLKGSGALVTINNAWVLVSLNLINKYVDTISDISKIGDISDESVVTDYLNQTITNLRSNTTSLVSDAGARQNLVSILNSALLSVSLSGTAVLALDDFGANVQINQTRSSIGNYINTVKALNGTTISTSTANTLFAIASKISSDSLKRGVDTTQIITGIPLVLTGKIIAKAKADVSSIRQIVSILKSRGFTITVTAQRLSPTQAIVSFFNSVTSQIFNFTTPDLALAVFNALGISEQMSFVGQPLTPEVETSLLISSPFVLELIKTMPNATISEGYIRCVDLTHILDLAAIITQSKTLELVTIGTSIGCIVGFLIQNPELVKMYAGIVQNAVLNVILPPVSVSGLKFNDLNGDHVRETGEPPLSGFGFRLSATGFSFDVTRNFTLTDSSGIFSFNNVRVPPTSQNIVIAEELSSTLKQQGWTNTTNAIVSIPFQPFLVKNDLLFGNFKPATNRLYVTNFNSNNVSVIDTTTNTAVATVAVGSGPIEVNPATNRLYVTNFNSNNVSVIDGSTNTVIGSPIPVGSAPDGVAVNPATNKVYVTNHNSNNVSVIDGSTNTVIGSPIPVGSAPVGIAVNQATNRLYVANQLSNNVSVIDATTNTVVATVPAGSVPGGVAVNQATNRLYVTNQFSNNVSVIDTTTNTVVATVAVGTNPGGIAVNPATNRVYVANMGSNNVSVIDGSTNTVIGSPIPVGSDPQSVAVNPATNRVYVPNFFSNNVSVIDTTTNTVVATVAVGSGPSGVAVNP